LHVSGTIRVPGDKSISHRALIFAALAPGQSRVTNILNSADVRATARALNALGASVPELTADIVVRGVPPADMHSPSAPLDCANSGTTTRLMMGVLSGLAQRVAHFEGDTSLSKRPMRRVAKPLMQMGARIVFDGGTAHDGLPLTVSGAELSPLVWQSEQASAQVKGAILLAALVAGVAVEVNEPHQSRDHTERMLRARGVVLDVRGHTVSLLGHQVLSPLDVDVPADPSSAAFFAALAALSHSGELRLTDVCINPTRIGAIHVLRRMGATLRIENERLIGGEEVGTIVVSHGDLVSTVIGAEEVPSCIDELPLIACLASRARGETRITGAFELRVKESDRITAVVDNLRAIGADADELPDGLCVRGHTRALRGTVVTHGDHRLAMAFAILGVLPGNEIVVDDPACVDVSFPSFWADLARATKGNVARSTLATPAGMPAIASSRLIIAIDGPAASGKSSTSQWVAEKLGVRHVDSGAFYRVLTALALRADANAGAWTAEALLANADRVSLRLATRSVVPHAEDVQDEELRSTRVTEHVSRVAQMPEVRAWVNARVRETGARSDVVVDGRDIGTAVFPDAALKIFLVADPWERARRRLMQRLGRGPSDGEIALETESLVARDALDAIQSVPARDAITIDTTALTQEEQVERIVALARATRARLHGQVVERGS
jgi:3-phosphoshikimate 1-carboxyvinyltransferase